MITRLGANMWTPPSVLTYTPITQNYSKLLERVKRSAFLLKDTPHTNTHTVAACSNGDFLKLKQDTHSDRVLGGQAFIKNQTDIGGCLCPSITTIDTIEYIQRWNITTNYSKYEYLSYNVALKPQHSKNQCLFTFLFKPTYFKKPIYSWSQNIHPFTRLLVFQMSLFFDSKYTAHTLV